MTLRPLFQQPQTRKNKKKEAGAHLSLNLKSAKRRARQNHSEQLHKAELLF
ncbi:unnamed protein product [Amoebophrya sp. A25]|nr:unnamed protein product [Amoebophrya sp. A25]|eukprot:GSA25T00019760001.1